MNRNSSQDMVTMAAYEKRGKTIQELCSKLAANRNEIAQLQFQLDKTFKHWSAKSMKLEKASTYWKNQCEKYQKVISAANENSQWHQKEPEIAGTKPAIEGMKKEKQPADGQYKTLYEEQLRITERQELEIDASRLAVKQLQSEKSALERHIEASNPYEGAVNDAIIALTRINAMADTKTVPQMYSGLKDIVVTKRDPNAIKKHGVAGMLNDPNDQKPDTYPFKVTHQARGNHVGKTESVVIGGARQQALPMTVPGTGTPRDQKAGETVDMSKPTAPCSDGGQTYVEDSAEEDVQQKTAPINLSWATLRDLQSLME